LDNFMKIRIFLGLCVVLGASFISVRAADNPAQAAARVALEQKLYELDHPQTPPPPVPVTPAEVVGAQPSKSAANFISVCAADNPAQASARVALEQKLYELDHPQTPPPPVPVTPAEVVGAQPGKSAANVTGIVSEKAVTPQTAPAPTTPVAAPVAVAPVAVAPAMSHLILSFFILSLLILSLLLLKLLLLKSRCYGSNQDSTSSGTYNAQANPVTRCD
jgi:hypothetical protein